MAGDQGTNVFLSLSSEEQAPFRDDLASVFERAGMNLQPSESVYKDGFDFSSQLGSANCSVHILFPQYGPLTNSGSSSARLQFDEARKRLSADPSFRIFVWQPPAFFGSAIEELQSEFITEVRNNISRNMVFSNAASAIQLADDIRSLMEKKDEVVFDLNATDIFLISNQLDENEANDIIDMLSDIVPVEKLNIIQDSDVDYSELCKQQIVKSKLAVIYFKESAEWALPFAQQVWKKIGGATTHTPILLIGDEDPDTNMNKKFAAPKVISLIVSGELIPLEIKVQYDKVAEAKP
jgi:hypothetical protein